MLIDLWLALICIVAAALALMVAVVCWPERKPPRHSREFGPRPLSHDRRNRP